MMMESVSAQAWEERRRNNKARSTSKAPLVRQGIVGGGVGGVDVGDAGVDVAVTPASGVEVTVAVGGCGTGVNVVVGDG